MNYIPSSNDKVHWYRHAEGHRIYFKNGWAVSIIPGCNGDTMECAVIPPYDGEMDIQLRTPDELPVFLAGIQSRTIEPMTLSANNTFTD
jgi:hypothetical protein